MAGNEERSKGAFATGDATVGEIMEEAYSCRFDANLGEVTRLLVERGVSSLPVVDGERRVVGFISDGDIMRAIAAHKTRSVFNGGEATMLYFDDEPLDRKARELKHRNVMELATRKVVCATPRATDRQGCGIALQEEVQEAAGHRRGRSADRRGAPDEHHAPCVRAAVRRMS